MTNSDSKNTIDITFLKSQIGDEKKNVVQILSVFKKAMLSFCELIGEHLSNENVAGIKDQTHKLAPSCQMLRLDYLYNLLRETELKSSTSVSTSQVKEQVDEALQIIKMVIPQIDHLVDNYE